MGAKTRSFIYLLVMIAKYVCFVRARMCVCVPACAFAIECMLTANRWLYACALISIAHFPIGRFNSSTNKWQSMRRLTRLEKPKSQDLPKLFSGGEYNTRIKNNYLNRPIKERNLKLFFFKLFNIVFVFVCKNFPMPKHLFYWICYRIDITFCTCTIYFIYWLLFDIFFPPFYCPLQFSIQLYITYFVIFVVSIYFIWFSDFVSFTTLLIFVSQNNSHDWQISSVFIFFPSRLYKFHSVLLCVLLYYLFDLVLKRQSFFSCLSLIYSHFN